MRVYASAACTPLLLVLLSADVAAQRLPVRVYNTTDGLASDRVYRIVPDSKRFLWFCTSNGLSRFDGERFTTYGPEAGLPYHSINDLLITRSGRYLLASNGGGVIVFDVSPRGPTVASSDDRRAAQSKVDAWRFRAYRVGSHGGTNRVNVLLEDRQGRIWAGTDRGLFVLKGWDEPMRFTRAPLVGSVEDWSVIVYALTEDRDGSLWVGTNVGLARRLPDGRVVHYRWPEPVGGIFMVARDRAGRLWVGHDQGVSAIMPTPVASLEVSSGSILTHRLPDREIRKDSIVLPDAQGMCAPGPLSLTGFRDQYED